MNRALPVILQVSLIYAAAAAAMSRAQLGHNSDTVMQALVSLLRWTPYYWGENRFGMLFPLLALPVTDPAANLIFQCVLTVWAGLLAIWFLARLTEDPSNSALITAVTFALLLVMFKAKAGLLMILQSTYIPPIALILCGWFAFTRKEWRLAARVICLAVALLLSFWINVANVVFIAVVAMLWPGFSWRDRIIGTGVVIAANAGATLVASLFPGQSFRELLPLSQWLDALNRLLTDASTFIADLRLLGLLLAAGAVLLARHRRWDPRYAIGVAACVQIGLVSLSEWVSRNNSDARYITPPLFVLCVLGAGTISGAVSWAFRKLKSPSAAYATATLIVISAATLAFGFPSSARAAGYLEQATRPAAQSFGRGPCTHLLGDYWRVWMAVYHDMLTGRIPPRHGVSLRSNAIRALWDNEPQSKRTYCAACADGMLEYFRVQQGVPPLKLTWSNEVVCQWNVR